MMAPNRVGCSVAACLIFWFLDGCASAVSWDKWWTYDGISGPSYWGLINPDWYLCSKGRRQSPINIEPSGLLFDPNLGHLHVDKHQIHGDMSNTGHSVVFKAEGAASRVPVNVTGGPLSYHYQVDEIHIHYGVRDNVGSEHTINDLAFPAEVQVYGFNSQLYGNFSEALDKTQGLVAISIMVKVGVESNRELTKLTDALEDIQYSGEKTFVRHLSVRELLPNTDFYITYEGSITMPACHETVIWIIMNKPIYMTQQQLVQLRKLKQGGPQSTKVPLGSNFRPPLPLHNRTVSTNIDFHNGVEKRCGISMRSRKLYVANNLGSS